MGTNDWRHRAACRDEDLPDTFHPPGESDAYAATIAAAKAVCRRCPVQQACADWAINNRIEHGVWGGLTKSERTAIRRREAKQASRERAAAEAAA